MLDNKSPLCTKEYIEKTNISVKTAITSTTSSPRLRNANGLFCPPSKYSALVNSTPPCLLLSSEDRIVVSRYTEELERVKAAYFKLFRSFNAEIHSSSPLDFPMFTYEFVKFLCARQNAPLSWNIFVSKSKVLCMQDMEVFSANTGII